MNKGCLPDTKLVFMHQIYNKHAEQIETKRRKLIQKCILISHISNYNIQKQGNVYRRWNKRSFLQEILHSLAVYPIPFLVYVFTSNLNIITPVCVIDPSKILPLIHISLHSHIGCTI